jgi:hypothetical protein
LNFPRLDKRYPIPRTMAIFALTILSLTSFTNLSARGETYRLKYDLGYSGIPFAGGAIVVSSNFTNLGQLTIQVTSFSFVSDFWSNGTRRVTSGFPFNLTAGMNKAVDTPVLIPTGASIGNHNVTSTATWRFSNSSGWFSASPVVASVKVLVSQRIGSLFSSFTTVLFVPLGAALVAIIVLVFLVVRQRKKPKPGVASPVIPQRNTESP